MFHLSRGLILTCFNLFTSKCQINYAQTEKLEVYSQLCDYQVIFRLFKFDADTNEKIKAYKNPIKSNLQKALARKESDLGRWSISCQRLVQANPSSMSGWRLRPSMVLKWPPRIPRLSTFIVVSLQTTKGRSWCWWSVQILCFVSRLTRSSSRQKLSRVTSQLH